MAESIAIDSSGKLVVAGTLWNGRAEPFTLFGITLARYKPDGSLDPSFGRNGRVTTVAGENPAEVVDDFAIDSAGRIVVSATWTYHQHLIRYLPDGRLDKTFGSGGMAPVGGTAMAIDSHNRIVLSGSGGGGTPSSPDYFILRRFKPNGTLDPTFVSDDGYVPGVPSALTIDSAGRILAAGGGGVAGVRGVHVARYLPNGRLDETFGSGGIATVPGDVDWYPHRVTIDSAGRILVDAGEGRVARFESDGQLDDGFGSGGIATTENVPISAGIDSSGRIVTAGYRYYAGDRYDFTLFALDSTGDPDPAFGSGGKAEMTFGAPLSLAADLAIDSADRPVAVGGAGFKCKAYCGYYLPFYPTRFAVARYTPSGVLDPSFGNGGRVATNRFPPETRIMRSIIQNPRRTAKFRFSAVGTYSGFKCRLISSSHPNPTFAPCSIPKVYSGLPSGSYTFQVRAIGSLGPDPTPAQHSFKIK